MKESQISREIRNFVLLTGGLVWSTEQGYRPERGGTRTTPGYPDLLVFYPDHGVWTFVEVKREKGKLNPAQERFRDACLETGAPWQLWRDVTDAFDWAAAQGVVESA